MSSKPWFAWYPSDFAAKTGHLSLCEKGAYYMLLDHYYSTGKPLPNDMERLCRITRASSETEVTAVKAVTSEFFYPNGDGSLHNKRADKELIRQKDFIEEQSRKGKLSAMARWGKKPVTEITEALPDCNLPQPQPYITTTTIPTATENQTKSKTKPRQTKKTSLPEHLEKLEPSPRLRAYFDKHGEKQWKAHLVYFVGYAKANGKQYADWDQAVINAVRDDWAGVRKVIQ